MCLPVLGSPHPNLFPSPLHRQSLFPRSLHPPLATRPLAPHSPPSAGDLCSIIFCIMKSGATLIEV